MQSCKGGARADNPVLGHLLEVTTVIQGGGDPLSRVHESILLALAFAIRAGLRDIYDLLCPCYKKGHFQKMEKIGSIPQWESREESKI